MAGLAVPIVSAFLLALTAGTALGAGEGHREAGAHEHGHATLNMAVEGSSVQIELIAPGSDIVGFEHEAKSAADMAKVGAAKQKLADGLSLFAPPPAANCKLKSATVDVEREGGDHATFHVLYDITCSRPDKLDKLTLNYFEAFAGAREIEMQLIAPNGQSRYEADRDNRTVTLKGLR